MEILEFDSVAFYCSALNMLYASGIHSIFASCCTMYYSGILLPVLAGFKSCTPVDNLLLWFCSGRVLI